MSTLLLLGGMERSALIANKPTIINYNIVWNNGFHDQISSVTQNFNCLIKLNAPLLLSFQSNKENWPIKDGSTEPLLGHKLLKKGNLI